MGHDILIKKVRTLFLCLDDKILIGPNWGAKNLKFFLEKWLIWVGLFLSKTRKNP